MRQGRKPLFDDKFNIVDGLESVKKTGLANSRYLTLQLVSKGLVKIDLIPPEGRGRPRVVYSLSGKGRGYLAISKNWKRK